MKNAILQSNAKTTPITDSATNKNVSSQTKKWQDSFKSKKNKPREKHNEKHLKYYNNIEPDNKREKDKWPSNISLSHK